MNTNEAILKRIDEICKEKGKNISFITGLDLYPAALDLTQTFVRLTPCKIIDLHTDC